MFSHLLDRMGMSLSILCLVHCLLFPLIALMLPVLGSTLFLHETTVHWILLGFALPVSLIAFRHGYRFHGDWPTMVIGLLGLVFLTVGVSHLLGHESEFFLTVPGALLLFIAHLRNWRHHIGLHLSKSHHMREGELEGECSSSVESRGSVD